MKLNMHLNIVIVMMAILCHTSPIAAQQKASTTNDTTLSAKEIKAVSLKDYKSFKASIGPLIKEMSTKRIVGLGEGTHGTAEFYKVRYWISRILIEEKGFDYIAFENDLSDVWTLNQQVSETKDLGQLMKSHLMSIWQNEETKEMLNWVKEYNATHQHKITLSGLDFPLLKPDVEMLISVLTKGQDLTLMPAVKSLYQAASLQDEAWIGMNDKSYKTDWKLLRSGSKSGYITADSIEKQMANLQLSPILKGEFQQALTNLKQGFAPFYGGTAEGDRDSLMANNAAMILKDSNGKMIIWAHNAHVGKTKIYAGAVGGTGSYLLKLFPNNYFVLGTGTANGTFAATIDVRPTNSNPMKAYPLAKPIVGSWDEMLANKDIPSFYFSPSKTKLAGLAKPLRLIGFGIKSDASTYDTLNLAKMFDAFLFIKDTHAPIPLK
ncbi:erythromycin esterase family protein [Pedobacter sp. ASV28]|uniref:erythromycin esterase family protein n=1 Tax=Pedobacter sp. ASV28 TaxID=2795123 RepID=UPI0018EB42E3|nr:erythromycin esterase family protein [Pedobacter sp. ASV28]